MKLTFVLHLHAYKFVSDIYSAVVIRVFRRSGPEVQCKNSSFEHFGKFSEKIHKRVQY